MLALFFEVLSVFLFKIRFMGTWELWKFYQRRIFRKKIMFCMKIDKISIVERGIRLAWLSDVYFHNWGCNLTRIYACLSGFPFRGGWYEIITNMRVPLSVEIASDVEFHVSSIIELLPWYKYWNKLQRLDRKSLKGCFASNRNKTVISVTRYKVKPRITKDEIKIINWKNYNYPTCGHM